MTEFREVQRFRQPWLMTLLAGELALFLGLTVAGILPAVVGFPVVGVTALTWLWVLSMSMVTEVRPEGLCVHFKMLWPKRIIPFDQIENVESTRYRPIRDYGGWGVRGAWPVKAFNVSGNHGVLLSLANGRTLLVGSQLPGQLAAALQPRLSNGHAV